MKSPDIARILGELSSRAAADAWGEFLDAYAALILRVIQFEERDPDDVSDCFLFVCEQLSDRNFRRLRRFRTEGPASFPTWVRAVVRNLSIDWHRKRAGRPRPFQSVSRLPVLEQEIFRCVYEGGMGLETAFFHLRPRFPALSRERLAEGVERVGRVLAPRQHWLLSTRKKSWIPIEEPRSTSEGKPSVQPVDPGPDPETLAASSERQSALARALSQIPRFDRLLLRLRFEEDLTLEQIARLTQMESPQSVDRSIRRILQKLRQRMEATGDAPAPADDERASFGVAKNRRGVRVPMTDAIHSEAHVEEVDE